MPPCTQYSTWVYKNQEAYGEFKDLERKGKKRDKDSGRQGGRIHISWNRHDRKHACSAFIGSSFLTIDRFVSLLCRSGIKAVLSKRTLGRLKQQKTGFYNAVDKMDHFLFAVLVIALHNDMHQTV